MLDLITQSQIWGFLLEEVKTRDLGLLVVSLLAFRLSRIRFREVRFMMTFMLVFLLLNNLFIFLFDQGRSGRMICMWKDWKWDGQAVWI